MSLPSLCLIEVASLLYLSSHLVLSLFFCPWFRESVSSRRSPVLTACLLHRYLKPSQSLSLWGPLSFPGWRPLGSSLRAHAVCCLAVRLCHHRLFGVFPGVPVSFSPVSHLLWFARLALDLSLCQSFSLTPSPWDLPPSTLLCVSVSTRPPTPTPRLY